MADEVGFKIYNKFYPLVLLQDWVWGDFALSHKLTDVTTEELFSSKADAMLLQQALISVAVGHIRSELSHDQIIDFVYKLKPSEVEEVGFTITIEDDGEGDASPPAESDGELTPSASTESSNTSTEVTPEKENPQPSGEPGLDTGSQE